MALTVLGDVDSMILKVFTNLNNSMTPWFYQCHFWSSGGSDKVQGPWTEAQSQKSPCLLPNSSQLTAGDIYLKIPQRAPFLCWIFCAL